ncbi:MAG: DNA-binding protein, partial [Candidatus Aenigmarchaeota archaeon]|nr:DNA-binding protein [Candidatus Aenigmarchaeota archaeon]
KCENHTAAIIILQDVFGLDSKDIRKAKNDRVDKQYYVDFRITEEEVKETMFLAEDFIADLRDFIERLSEQDIKDYRKLFLALIDRKN